MRPSLTEAQLEHWNTRGYLVLDDVLDLEDDIAPVVDEYAALLDTLCSRWFAEGKLTSTYAELPFGQRLIKVFTESGQAYYQHFDIALPGAGVTEQTPIHTGPAVFNLLTSPRLLDAVEQLIGPEIYSNPVQHVRIKPPQHLVPEGHSNSLVKATNWHQDQGVILPEADETIMLTVWIPITDATVENGCLAIIPGSHQEGLATHCLGTQTLMDLHIPDKFLPLEEAVPVPIKRGGVLLMHRCTKHSSLTNQSDEIRWSFDLRYNPIGQPTGRPAFPGFVARSQSDPASALPDHEAWTSLWHAARTWLAESELQRFNRWEADALVCA
jgi:phytanoyl-CoA hydroxylase